MPMSTYIAFSLGVLSTFDSRVPFPLRMFLTTLAAVDDIGGIAAGYTEHIQLWYIVGAAIILCVLCLGQYTHIKSKMFYLSLSVVVWFLLFNSGVL